MNEWGITPSTFSLCCCPLWTNTPQSWGFWASVRQKDCSGSEGRGSRVGATLEKWSGRDKETAHAFSGQQSPSQGGPKRGYEASGPTLNKKTAAICLHCYLCFKCMTGCRCNWGSLNLLPFRLLPQSLTWQVTSFKKHCVRMFPPLLFK